MSPVFNRSRLRALALVAAGTALTAGGLAALAPIGASASSHREAPLISGLPQYDNTDVYAFVSPDKPSMVTIVANWIPFEDPAGGPNFYPFTTDGAHYIRIDNDGDARADLIYRISFTTTYQTKKTFLYNTGPVTSLKDPDLNVRQTYQLQVKHVGPAGRFETILKGAPVAPSFVGKASMPDYASLRAEAVHPIRSGGSAFAGQADDPFFLDLRVFDLLYGGDLSEVGNDTLAGYNVNTIALQLPKSQLLGAGNDPVIGLWSTTNERDSNNAARPVSRLGNPLVNEVVIPVGRKDAFNRSRPRYDGQFLKYVTNPEPARLLHAIYGVKVPPPPRNDLVSVFLTGIKGLNQPSNLKNPGEMVRLNTSIAPTAHPKRLGVLAGDTAGFPNGRRLTDDVVDIELQALAGETAGKKFANDLGDAVNRNDSSFMSSFPYVALPHSGSRPRPTSAEGATVLNGGNYRPSGGFPAVPVGALSLGLLTLVAGTVALRRGRRSPLAVTA